jgi:NAD(P)-dependent dehydrogenase (short-subunit alcohol dehydrogenase family)
MEVPMTLTGKTALVTGGNRGIGLATVRALALAGANVHFTARSAANIAAAQRELGDIPATGHHVNMTDRLAMTTLFETPFDILINNAGIIGPIGRILDVSIEDWARNIDTNLTAAFHASQLALAHMTRTGGTIVNLSSGAAHRPQEGWSAYCAGKAGLAMLTRSVHMEYGPQVRVFGFAPGVVDTDMQGTIRASGINPVSQLPRGSLAPAHEPAQIIAWLCTPAAAPLAGQELDARNPELRAAAGLPPLA